MNNNKQAQLINGYWVVETNKWNANIYTKEQAEKYADTLINCTNCVNCINCDSCRFCNSCRNSRNCISCNDCSSCRDCSDCSSCHDCSDIKSSIEFLEQKFMSIFVNDEGFKKAIDQSKEMHKKEIKYAYDAGLFDGSMDDVNDRMHKDYYKETFGGNK